MSETHNLRKMSVKSIIGGRVRSAIDMEIAKPTMLFTLYGAASGMKTGESDNGPWIAFVGDFKALRTEDGAVFESNKLFVPRPIEELLEVALNREGAGVVEFAFEVGAQPDDDSVTGYVYVAKNLLQVQNQDVFRRLEETLTEQGNLKTVDEPAKEPPAKKSAGAK